MGLRVCSRDGGNPAKQCKGFGFRIDAFGVLGSGVPTH